MDVVTGLFSALGLSTAAGLNAYIPLLVVGLLDRYTNLIDLAAPYDWLSNPWVLLVIAVIALVDFVGDKVPVVDHVLHLVGLVIAPVAGAITALAASGGGVNPTLVAICGVVVALGVHGARATARPLATATTAGFANPVLSAAEDGTSLVLAVLAVALPLVALLVVVLLAIGAFMLLRRVTRGRQRGALRR